MISRQRPALCPPQLGPKNSNEGESGCRGGYDVFCLFTENTFGDEICHVLTVDGTTDGVVYCQGSVAGGRFIFEATRADDDVLHFICVVLNVRGQL